MRQRANRREIFAFRMLFIERRFLRKMKLTNNASICHHATAPRANGGQRMT
jgi:hypothetical protein